MGYKFDLGQHGVVEQRSSSREKKKDKTMAEQTLGKTSVEEGVLAKNKFDIQEIDLDLITPRSINKYSQTRIDMLADSIKNTNNRLIHPIVLVKASDLSESSEVIKKFKENNISVDNMVYILVAGERRYTAFKKLRAEWEIENANKQGLNNPFNTITANVLSPEEAKRENTYYDDSNLMARQLNPVEIILHIKDALEKVTDETEKRQALIKMGKNPKTDNIVQDEYVAFYLEKELGITDFGSSSLKTYSSIVNNCDPYVIEKIMSGEFSSTAARALPKLEKDVQKQLVDIYINDGSEAFYQLAESAKKSKKAGKGDTKQRYLYMDARDSLKPFKNKLEKEIIELTEISEKMSGEDKKLTKSVITKMLELKEKVDSAIENFNEKK